MKLSRWEDSVSMPAAARRGFRKGCVTFGAVAAGLIVSHWLTGGQAAIIDAEQAPHATEQAAPSHIVSLIEAKQTRLVESGQCWTGDAPADVEVPGSVLVVEIVRGERVAMREDHLVGPALEQIFDGVDHDLTILAFCR
jgi:hypothetical protein